LLIIGASFSGVVLILICSSPAAVFINLIQPSHGCYDGVPICRPREELCGHACNGEANTVSYTFQHEG
jgi:hypothetical protein